LGLDTGDSWFLENCPDFAPGLLKADHSGAARKPIRQESKTEGYHSAELRQDPEPALQIPVSPNQSYLIIAAVVMALLAILAYLFL
jgi:hypothetical protein